MTETNCQNDRQAGPRIGVRRWGDACFHEVQEETPDGYVVEGFLIPRDDVWEFLDLASGEICNPCPQCHDDA
jgi:hypothetical protein